MITRKTLIALSALSTLAIASTAFAQGFVPLAPIPGLTDPTTATSVISSGGFATFFNNLYKYCVGLSATLAVIMIIWGGLEYSTQDVPGAKQNGKEKIQNAIFGLVLVLSPVLVFSIINPRILNLSVSLDRIDLTTTQLNTSTQTNSYTLSNTEIASRQSNGINVLFAFTVPSNYSANQVTQAVSARISDCTSWPQGGPGIILTDITGSNGDTGYGGYLHYVCQTCPSNTTLTVSNSCTLNSQGARICGSCVVNSSSASSNGPTLSAAGDVFTSPQSGVGAYCFTYATANANGTYYCSLGSDGCLKAQKDTCTGGQTTCSAIATVCTPY